MSSVATEYDTAGKFFHPNSKEDYPFDEDHPVYMYFNGSFLECQTIINDKKCNGILLITKEKKLTIINIPQAHTSFKMKSVEIYGFLDTSCSNTIPVQLNHDVLKDVLVLAEEPDDPCAGSLVAPNISI